MLRDEGFAVDCFERSDRVGGHWHTDYDCLHLITPRDSSGFEGNPMPSDYPLFPSRDQMRDYILGFAAHHGLGSHIRFNTAVTAVAAARRGRARRLGGHDLRRRDAAAYDGVIVANGHLWDPFVPEYPGRVHRARACTPAPTATAADIEGDRVLVVGAGNSGCDLAVDAAQAGRETYLPCATGSCSSPRPCSGGRARSCRCSRACPIAPAGARDARR